MPHPDLLEKERKRQAEQAAVKADRSARARARGFQAGKTNKPAGPTPVPNAVRQQRANRRMERKMKRLER